MGALGFVAALLFGLMMWFAAEAIAAAHDPQLHRLCAATMCLTGAALAQLLAEVAA